MTARLRREHVCSGRQIQRARLWRETFQGRHDRALIVRAAQLGLTGREAGRDTRGEGARDGPSGAPTYNTSVRNVARRGNKESRAQISIERASARALKSRKKVRVRIRKEAALRARFVADRSVLYVHGGLVAAEAALRHLTPGRAAYWPSSPPCASSSCSCSW